MKSAAILILAGAAVLGVPAAAQQASEDGLLMTTKWSLETSKPRKKAPAKPAQQQAAGASVEGPKVPAPDRLRVPATRKRQSSAARSPDNTRVQGQKVLKSFIREKSQQRR